jgi:multidrug transporter EmrE-like cation transporter
LSTIGAVFLKRAAGAGGTGWVLAAWVATGGVVFAGVALARKRGAGEPEPRGTRSPWRWVAFHAATFLGMQALTLAVFRGTLLAYSFVYFQLGMVLQVVVGRVLFGEPAFARRLLACLVMAAGAGLVLWRG